MKKRVILIGLDGLSYGLFKKVKEKYNLENLDSVVEAGISGPLRSVLPYSSAPNWASITTGVNPGKHGFYSFFFPRENAYEYQFPNSKFIKTKRIWDILSSLQKRVIIVNVPATYPPGTVNGVMVTGMLTPGISSDFAYPQSLSDEIRKDFPDYVFDTNWAAFKGGDIDELIDALLNSVRKRRDLIYFLLKNYSADFIMIVYTETDRLFHSALHLLDDLHPHYNRQDADRNDHKIAEIFRTIDDSIGMIKKNYLKDGTMIIVSDHGFAPVFKKVYLNNWLAEQGYFCVKDQKDVRIKNSFKSMARSAASMLNISEKQFNRIQAHVLSILRSSKDLPLLNKVGRKIVEKVDSMSYIDWDRSRAYYLQEWGIRINLKGREPRGIVELHEYDRVRESIISSLKQLRDTDTGELIIKQAVKREEVCHGDSFDSAPDIFLVSADSPGYELTSDLAYDKVFAPMGWKVGDHSLHGMYCLSGSNIRKTQLTDVTVTDIVPTILHLMGIAVPDYIDGKILHDAVSASKQTEFEHVAGDLKGKEKSDNDSFEDDKDAIRDRLKGLGYF
jgi:predicted AlkP superfamily phosphohydrolase/phosphomutase